MTKTAREVIEEKVLQTEATWKVYPSADSILSALKEAGYVVVPVELTRAMEQSIIDELDAQELDPMEFPRKARCIWKTALHSAETGQRGYTTEEVNKRLSAATQQGE